MKRHDLQASTVAAVFLFLPVGHPSLWQSQTNPVAAVAPAHAQNLRPGAVVDVVAPGSAAEKAGLRPGDILSRWLRGEAEGEIESPFDVSFIDIEQGPRGAVTMQGSRGDEERTWTIEPGKWGLQTRPHLPAGLLSLYQEVQEPAKAGKPAEKVDRWRAVLGHLDDSTPVDARRWLRSRAAEAFAEGQQWNEADDAYRQALQQEAGAAPVTRGQLLQGWARMYQQRSDWPSAEKYYQQSISEIRKLGTESLMLAAALGDLGVVSRLRGDLTKAEELFRQAVDIRRRLAPGSLAVAASLNNLGIVAFNRGDIGKAEEYYRQALDIRQTLAPGSLEVAASFNNLGNVSWRRGDLAKAEEYYRHALDIRQKLAPGSLDVAISLNNLGVIADGRGGLAKAEEYYRHALDIRQKLAPGSLDVALTLHNLGNVAQERGDLAKAEEYYRHALDIRQRLAPGSLDVALNLHNLGNAAHERGDLAKAEEYYRHALDIRQRLAPGSLDVAASFNSLGSIADERGDLAKAEEYYRQAFDIRHTLAPGSLDVAESFNNLGGIADERGDLAKAEEYYRQAFDIRHTLAPGSLDVAASFNNLGLVADERGDLARAEEYHRQAIDIRQRLAPGSLDVALSFNNLGVIADERGDLAKAEEYGRQALDIRQRLAPGSLAVAASFHHLGTVALDRGDLGKAEEYYRQALDIRQTLSPGSLDVAGTMHELGAVAFTRGDLGKAEEYHRQALDIKQKLAPGSIDVAASFNCLGYIAWRRGDLAQAEDYFTQELTIKETRAPGSLGAAWTENGLGDLARTSGDLGKAEQHYRQALAIREKWAPGSKQHAESLAAVASILREKQQLDGAVQYYAQAVSALDKQTARLGGSEEVRAGFRANHGAIYKDFVGLLLARNRLEQALEVLERSRAQGLIEMLSAAHIDVHQGVDPALRERERSLAADVRAKSNRRIQLLSGPHNEDQSATLDKEIEKVLAQHQDVEAQIRATSPGYAALTQPLPVSTKEMQRLLDSETVLLEYAFGEERSHVFVVTSDSLRVHELAKGAEIEGAVRRVYALLTARNHKVKGETELERDRRLAQAEAVYPQAVTDLSRMVLAPVAVQPGKKRLLIVADGALQYIPFALLPTPAAWWSTASERAPLAAAYEIVTLPSAQTLAVLRQQATGRTKAPKAVAVLADPVFDAEDARVRARGKSDIQKQEGGATPSRSADQLLRSLGDVGLSVEGRLHLARLAFSRQEATAIVAAVPAGQSLAAFDFKANRQTATSVDLAQYRTIHYATHGLLNSVHPQLSGLVLSMVDEQGRPQDGYLDLGDIYNLNLPAELVVLSACETGLGKEISGEGVIGLTRGFMYAGASRVVASLWKVDDVATAELMGRFYRAMEKDGMRPAAALRRAQMEMWQQERWRTPYYWAAFQLQGEWK